MIHDEPEILRMSEVQLREVDWLWYPYIPFGKLTILQGDPGEGKTTLALRLAAACSAGKPMPGMKPLPPFNVIYQTAEDGLEDTVKPRLTEADADQDRIINIREDKKSLHLLDSRIEKAIVQCDARLLILDPLQGYLGERIDMNRANEIREVMKSVGQVAQRTGCAVVLVGHLNKAAGLSSAYRGLGSIDFGRRQEVCSWWAGCGKTKLSVSSCMTNPPLYRRENPLPFSSETEKASAGSTAMTRYPPKNCCPASLHSRKPRLRRRRNSSAPCWRTERSFTAKRSSVQRRTGRSPAER